jgi:5S rRNA maturation endonuclease (ribonuclease M5)
MLIKTFSHGKGGGDGPVNYCISETVPAYDPVTRFKIPGQFVNRDPAPVVMRGDPARTRMLIDSSENVWKYTSGVIAFEENDKPNEAEQIEVMQSFEKMAFAGLEADQYDILWVKHEHEGNVELHYVTPRLELTTGKSLNVAPPGHQKAFDAWRDSWNYLKGWASPNEPERARLVRQDDHTLKTDAARLKADLPKADDPKRLITEYLVTCIESGKVRSRVDIVDALRDAEIEITRQGKDYLSVRPEAGAKPVRLKGLLYDAGFQIEYDRAAAIRSELGGELGRTIEGQEPAGSYRNPGADAERARIASGEVERIIESRAGHNRQRYQQPRFDSQNEVAWVGERDQNRVERSGSGDQHTRAVNSADAGLDRQASQGRARQNDISIVAAAERITRSAAEADPANALADEVALVGTGSRLPRDLRRSLGLDAVPASRSSESISDATADASGTARSSSDVEQAEGADLGLESARGQHRQVRGDAAWRRAIDRMAQWIKEGRAVGEELRGSYDRVRDTVINRISNAIDAVRRGYEALVGTEQQLATAGANLGFASVKFDEVAQSVGSKTDRVIGVLKMNRDDELARFKMDINFIEYAESLGYEIEGKESSRASAVMRRGDDKIVVATDADGHGIYFSVKDDADNGSIIDFVQKRSGLNLGQVRQELRPWTGNTPSSYRPVAQAAQRAKPQPSTADRRQVLAVWMQMQAINGHHAYLEQQRGISPATLADARFAGHVRIDGKGNAAFPHYDKDGLAGYELKNDGFTGFAKNGQKAVWHSANITSAQQIVLVESAIDALSHAQMHRTDAAYISVGGAMSDHQRDLVRGALTKAAARGATIVIATDADEAGHKLAKQLTDLAAPGAQVERQQPTQGKDWNDNLKALQVDLQRTKAAKVAAAREVAQPPEIGGYGM